MVDPPSRIVVIRAGALGDVLLTLPALHALRERYPDAAIQVVGYPGIWEVAGDLADEIVSIDRQAGIRPRAEMLPMVGFNPTTLPNAAGTRPEAAVSVARAKRTIPAATAQAEPEEFARAVREFADQFLPAVDLKT